MHSFTFKQQSCSPDASCRLQAISAQLVHIACTTAAFRQNAQPLTHCFCNKGNSWQAGKGREGWGRGKGGMGLTTRSSASAPLVEALIGGQVHVRCAQITAATRPCSSFCRKDLTDDLQGRLMGVSQGPTGLHLHAHTGPCYTVQPVSNM